MSRALTPRTRLDTLRKDAKRWLKAVRAGDAKAVARLKAAWPKAPAQPALRDLQHALALEYGQSDWIGLKAAVDDLALQRRSREERIDTLLRHAWDGDVRIARRVLERDPSVARESIFTAAACGDLQEVERRLATEPGAAKAVGGSRAWTALAYCTYGRLDPVNAVEIARRLLDAGADPNFQFDDGWGCPFKVLTGAIRLGEGARPSHPKALELVELLVARGADPYDLQALYNISIVGEDTYWYGVLWGLCAQAGTTARWRSMGEESIGGRMMVNSLDYLLGNAVGHDHLVRAEWLLDRGADPNTPHAYTRRPVLELAELSGFAEVAALLLQRGAKPTRLEGLQAFQAACLLGREAEARRLAALDPALARNPMPILTAAAHGKPEAVKLLLSLGAPVGGLDHDGVSPIHRAVQSGSRETVELLLAAGADVNLRERKWGGTALSWASVLGRPHLVPVLAPLSRDPRALTRLGLADRLAAVLHEEPALADQRMPDAETPTPLYCLPDDEERALAVARVLLAHGADAKVRDGKGRTPAEAARERELDEVADLIDGC